MCICCLLLLQLLLICKTDRKKNKACGLHWLPPASGSRRACAPLASGRWRPLGRCRSAGGGLPPGSCCRAATASRPWWLIDKAGWENKCEERFTCLAVQRSHPGTCEWRSKRRSRERLGPNASWNTRFTSLSIGAVAASYSVLKTQCIDFNGTQ